MPSRSVIMQDGMKIEVINRQIYVDGVHVCDAKKIKKDYTTLTIISVFSFLLGIVASFIYPF